MTVATTKYDTRCTYTLKGMETIKDSDLRVFVVVPTYNAERTLRKVLVDLPWGLLEQVIVVDDCSVDGTVQIAHEFDVNVIRHTKRCGYGAAQKTAYEAALGKGASIVIMVHGDYQYDPRLVTVASDLIALGVCDVVLGNRIRTRKEALAGGMPLIKYVANRSLTLLENLLCGQNLGEWHSGFRAYSRGVLETLPLAYNSDDFVCDSQVLIQCVHFGFRIGDIPMPVRYFEAMSSIRFADAAKYSIWSLGVIVQWYLHRAGVKPSPLFKEDGAANAKHPSG